MSSQRSAIALVKSVVRRSPRLTARLSAVRTTARGGRARLAQTPTWHRAASAVSVSRRLVRGDADLAQSYERIRGFPHAGADYELVLRRVYERVLRPGDCVFDLGAHVGKHSLPMAMAVGATGRVVAVEPIGWAVERLRRRVVQARLDDVVAVKNLCVGSTAGTVTFNIVNDRPGLSSLHIRPGLTDTTATVIEQVTLDNLAAEHGPPRFVKIDVEGAEPDVLDGGVRLLATHRPILHLEIVPRALGAFGRTVGDIHDVLAPLGYRMFDLIGTDLSRRDQWERSAQLPAPCDYLAVHADDPALRSVRSELRHSFLRPSPSAERPTRPVPSRVGRATPSARCDVTIVPTTAEAAVEAGALVRLLISAGVDASVALHPDHATAAWLTELDGVTCVELVGASAHRYVVVAADDSIARPLAKMVGRQAVHLRTSGIEPMRVGTPGAAQRYRGYAKVLLRSRLEVAELGDRDSELLPVPIGMHAAAHAGRARTVIAVPSLLADRPDLRSWTRAAADVASRFDEVVIAGSDRAAAGLTGMEVRTLDLDLLRTSRRVVLPLCDDVSLVQALGAEAVVYDPAARPSEWSKPWLEALPMARDRGRLRRLLGGSDNALPADHGRWLGGLCRMASSVPNEGSAATRWIAALDLT